MRKDPGEVLPGAIPRSPPGGLPNIRTARQSVLR